MLGRALKCAKMALSNTTTSPLSSPRRYCKDSRDFAQKFFIDERHVTVFDSHWTYLPQNSKAKTLITCEHASNRFPQQYPKETDLIDTHWASDIGAEDISGALASNMRLPLLCSRISRLIIDVNRPVTSDTMFRLTADGKPISINSKLTAEEKQERIDRYWKPYRFELGEILTDHPNVELVVSIHSFTPNYEGSPRECEIGVLYVDSKREAQQFIQEFASKGYKVVENEPWPASLCDILKPVVAAGRQMVILEVRNDLATNPAFKHRLEADIQAILESLGVA